MKNNILKTIGLCAALGIFSLFTHSCTRDLTGLNVDPKHPSVLPSASQLATGQYQEFYYMYTPSVNFNNYRFFTQQWAETTYIDESNYNLVTRTQPANNFDRMYVYALNNFETAKQNLPNELATSPENADPAVVNNKWAILELSQVFTWENIVDTYGDVPYSEALKAESIKSPKYDDAKGIYTDLLKRLDVAIGKINTTKAGYSSDLVYKGNMTKWKKFANSLKLRLALNLADVDPETSKSVALAALASGVIDSPADSYTLNFDGATFSNPVFDELVASGRNDFIPSDVIVNPMNTMNDPRRSPYFTKLDGVYIGGVFGKKNPFGSYSHINPTFAAAAAPATLLGYTEVLFLQAELAARFNIGTVATLYKSAVTASMTENGVSPTDAAVYLLANPYDGSSTAAWKKSIGYESYIAMWNSPFAAWLFARRLDYPVLVNPATSYQDGVPVRLIYSDAEYLVNNTNVSAAASKIGGDKVITKLFWDKF